MSTMRRRTSVMLVSRSIGPSGRAASPTAPSASRRISRSGRTGGEGGRATSAMGGLRELGFDLVGEKQAVDAPVQLLEGRRAQAREPKMVRVELGLDPAGMRREHQDAAADQQRL